jgi:hypothetical protein
MSVFDNPKFKIREKAVDENGNDLRPAARLREPDMTRLPADGDSPFKKAVPILQTAVETAIAHGIEKVAQKAERKARKRAAKQGKHLMGRIVFFGIVAAAVFHTAIPLVVGIGLGLLFSRRRRQYTG